MLPWVHCRNSSWFQVHGCPHATMVMVCLQEFPLVSGVKMQPWFSLQEIPLVLGKCNHGLDHGLVARIPPWFWVNATMVWLSMVWLQETSWFWVHAMILVAFPTCFRCSSWLRCCSLCVFDNKNHHHHHYHHQMQCILFLHQGDTCFRIGFICFFMLCCWEGYCDSLKISFC